MTTTEVRRSDDAIRTRALAAVLNERGLTGPTDVAVETGSDGRCIVTLTMAELDWLTAEACLSVGLGDDIHEDCGTWTDDDLDEARREGRSQLVAELEKLATES